MANAVQPGLPELDEPQALSVSQLNQRLQAAINVAPGVNRVWICGETSDVRMAGPHMYMELLEKDPDGNTVSKIKANIWGNQLPAISRTFLTGTGMKLASGMKVKVYVNSNYHPAYGMSVNITRIDASFTLGEAARLRNEILHRLEKEGLMAVNQSLKWPLAPTRIAVVSAPGAAGYGDFINQIYSNSRRLAFTTTLFSAVMQGVQTVPSVMGALAKIAARRDEFDTVVIIRGGGASSDLQSFDNYELARAVATMPLPVIVGIGHERDTTVLDYVAAMRVKTPTAAAEWLIARTAALLDALERAAQKVHNVTAQYINASREQLARHAAVIGPAVAMQLSRRRDMVRQHATALQNAVQLATSRQHAMLQMALGGVCAASRQRTSQAAARLDRMADNLAAAANMRLALAGTTLEKFELLTSSLSPVKILERGFSYTTLADGTPLTSVDGVKPGQKIITNLADGKVISTTDESQKA